MDLDLPLTDPPSQVLFLDLVTAVDHLAADAEDVRRFVIGTCGEAQMAERRAALGADRIQALYLTARHDDAKGLELSLIDVYSDHERFADEPTGGGVAGEARHVMYLAVWR